MKTHQFQSKEVSFQELIMISMILESAILLSMKKCFQQALTLILWNLKTFQRSGKKYQLNYLHCQKRAFKIKSKLSLKDRKHLKLLKEIDKVLSKLQRLSKKIQRQMKIKKRLKKNMKQRQMKNPRQVSRDFLKNLKNN